MPVEGIHQICFQAGACLADSAAPVVRLPAPLQSEAPHGAGRGAHGELRGGCRVAAWRTSAAASRSRRSSARCWHAPSAACSCIATPAHPAAPGAAPPPALSPSDRPRQPALVGEAAPPCAAAPALSLSPARRPGLRAAPSSRASAPGGDAPARCTSAPPAWPPKPDGPHAAPVLPAPATRARPAPTEAGGFAGLAAPPCRLAPRPAAAPGRCGDLRREKGEASHWMALAQTQSQDRTTGPAGPRALAERHWHVAGAGPVPPGRSPTGRARRLPNRPLREGGVSRWGQRHRLMYGASAQDASVRRGPSGGARRNGSASRPARSCSSSSRACRLRLRFHTGLAVWPMQAGQWERARARGPRSMQRQRARRRTSSASLRSHCSMRTRDCRLSSCRCCSISRTTCKPRLPV